VNTSKHQNSAQIGPMSTPNTIVGHAANNALVAYIKHRGNYRVIGGCNVSGVNLHLFIRKYVGGTPLLGWGIMKQIFGVRRGRGWARRAWQRGHGQVLAHRAQGMGVSSSSLSSYSRAIPLSRCHVIVPLHCRVIPSSRSCIVVPLRRCIVMSSLGLLRIQCSPAAPMAQNRTSALLSFLGIETQMKSSGFPRL
jgi:hypothetical protein